jgi:hypothetical protein
MRSETRLKIIAICTVAMFFNSGYTRADTWTTLDMPGASRTVITGIDGSNLVGWYADNTGPHGFLYNGTSWASLNLPWTIDGISGNNIVAYSDQGLIYNYVTGNMSSFQIQLGSVTPIPYVTGISGNYVVGYYKDIQYTSGLFDGFLYNISTDNWTSITAPGAVNTYIYGISGDTMVGYGAGHGLLYNLTNNTFTFLDVPGYQGTTNIECIDASNLVCSSSNGWSLYNRTTGAWSTLNVPEGGSITGISGNNIVGWYSDASGTAHGYIEEIPEPATLLLLGLGAGIVRRKRS